MGAQASRDVQDEQPDERVMARAWREGVPFTLLHDEGFVVEKYQELVAAAGLSAAKYASTKADKNVEITFSGLDEVSRDEMQHEADMARMRLFGQPRRKDDSGTSSTGSAASGPPSPGVSRLSEKGRTATALAAMTGNTLSRAPPGGIASEKLRAQRVALIQSYFEQIAVRMKSEASVAVEGTSEGETASPGSAKVTPVSAAGSPEQPLSPLADEGNMVLKSASVAGIFSVSSFRMQLEMLRELRVMLPRMFESGTLAIVQTLLDSAPFALSNIAADSPEEVILKDARRFCLEILKLEHQGQPLLDTQRQVLLLLLLALGTSSGRVSLLLEFIDAFLGAPSESLVNDAVGGPSWRGQPFATWVDAFIRRIQSFRVDFVLGTFEDGSFVKKFTVKALSRASGTPAHEESGPSVQELHVAPKALAGIATDGIFAYTWSVEKGLAKVGTGLNFTIAGRVYSEAPAARYLQAMNKQLEVEMLVYGFSNDMKDVTDVVWKEVVRCSQRSDDSAHFQTVRDLLAGCDAQDIANIDVEPKLLVSLLIGKEHKVRIFGAGEIFDLTSLRHEVVEQCGVRSDQGSDISICRAWYGNMEVLSSAALAELRKQMETVPAASDDDDEVGESGVLYTRELLEQLLTLSDIPLEKVSESKHLVAILGAGGAKGAHVLSEGDRIQYAGDQRQSPYFTTLIFCDGSLYLSILYPEVDRSGLLSGKGYGAQRSRKLLRIDPQDLSVLELVSVGSESSSSGVISASARGVIPVWTYVTEGRFIYEIEMTADQFGVSVFAPKSIRGGPTQLRFVRSLALAVQTIESSRLSLCLTGLRNMKMGETTLNFAVPGFYTNGAFIGMLIAGMASEKSSSAKNGTTCILFDCDNGHIKTSGDGDAKTGCLERSIDSASASFDARNNLLWLFDAPKSALLSYKNAGRKITLSEIDFPTGCVLEDVSAETTNEHFAERTALVLLGTLYKNAEASDPSHERPTAADAGSFRALTPFAVDLDMSTFRILLAFISKYATLFKSNQASISQMQTLQSCLGVLNTNLEQLLRSPDGSEKKAVLTMLRADLLNPLEILMQSSDTSRKGIHEATLLGSSEQVAAIEDAERVRGQVAAVVLDLYTTSIHIFHADVNKQLTNVLKHLELWQQARATQMELKILGRLLAHLCSRVKVIYQSMQASDETLQQFVKLVEFAMEVQSQQLRWVTEPSNAGNGAVEGATTPKLARGAEASSELISLVNGIMQAAFVPIATVDPAARTKKAFDVALTVFTVISKACTTICSDVVDRAKNPTEQEHWPLIEKELKDGFVGILMPVVLSSGVAFLRHLGKAQVSLGDYLETQSGDSSNGVYNDAKHDLVLMRAQFLEFLGETKTRMLTLQEKLESLIQSFAPDQREQMVETISTVMKTETLESAHQYENNMDVITELQFPGASYMTITFDPQTRTEVNYDYITFYKDSNRDSYYGTQCYSGRDNEHNWPGIGENPPLKIESDHCFVLFHSDGSNTDWGYKFTAVAEIVGKCNMLQQHWLVFLQEVVVQMLDETIKLFVNGALFAPVEEVEVENEQFLQSDLLKSGVYPSDPKSAKVLQLLQDFVDPPESSGAEKVINALLEKSGSPRKNAVILRSSSFKEIANSAPNHHVNSAVRAVAAAILHHNMWGMDAHAFATDLRSDISEQLLRGWNNAQKMRDWFHLGDAADAAISAQSTPSRRQSGRLRLRRQPSAFKGLTEESLEILCKNVIERAKFLLEMTPVSFAYVKGAKHRWGLLVKYGHAIGKQGISGSPLEKWHNLVDELQAARDLHDLFEYRRSASARLKSGLVKSATEQVLEFIQSDVDVEEIRQILAARNQRAKVRVLGLESFGQALDTCLNVRLQVMLLESFSSTMESMAREKAMTTSPGGSPSRPAATSSETILYPPLHFDTSLSGCDETLRQRIALAFGRCLWVFSRLLSSSMATGDASSPLTVGVLKCCAIDYDVEDSYLLEESRMLPQILPLFASKSIRARHAAQTVLGVLISRFLAGSASSGHDVDDQVQVEDVACGVLAFQGELISAVGLQLADVVSAIQSFRSSTNQTRGVPKSVPQYLPEYSPGLTAACSDGTSVTWNHSIMLWVYASTKHLVNALKVGDEVRRGPDWSGANEAESGEKKTGLVVEISSPTSVHVRWQPTGDISECKYDPKHGVFEVILEDGGVGGTIFFKGNKNLVPANGAATPWSHFGLYLNDNRMLTYKIGCGSDKEIVYETNCELDADEWAHVAIVQEESTLKIFVNGSIASQHLLDSFLTVAGTVNASDSVIIESNHPFEDSVDQYFPVHIPGATKIRVTFDPLCDIDGSTGFVRLHKDSKCVEYWGEEKYTGKYSDPERNFPGAQNHRVLNSQQADDGDAVGLSSLNALEIPSDRFVVYFHNEGSSNGWGFRLLASPEFSDMEAGPTKSALSLNPYPFYFGEAPNRVLHEPAAKAWVYQPKVLDFPISENELTLEIQATCPPTEHPSLDLPGESTLHIIGLIRACAEATFGRRLIGTPDNIGHLMFLSLDKHVPMEVSIASVRVLTDLAGLMTPDIVDSQFKRCFPGVNTGFVETLFNRLAEGLNVWRAYQEADSSGVQLDGDQTKPRDGGHLGLRRSAQSEVSLMAGYISLLRGMVDFFDWRKSVLDLMLAALRPIQSRNKAHPDLLENAIGGVLASFALLGGNYQGVYIGGRVKCCVNVDGKGTLETGYLMQFCLENGEHMARVLFDCDPSRPVAIPVDSIEHLGDEEQAELERFITRLSPFATEIKELYESALRVDANVTTTDGLYQPKLSKKENVEVLESKHPYAEGEDVTYPLQFHGAREIVVFFDEMSCTAGPNDYVQFIKRDGTPKSTSDSSNSDKQYWGEEKYFGESFPGVGTTPALHIPAAAVDVHFHTEGSSNTISEWGFKLTAHSFEDVIMYPPEVPPEILESAISDIQARCLKSLGQIFRTQKEPRALSAFEPLLPELVKVATSPSPGRPIQLQPKSQVLESKHPYGNSLLEQFEISFAGASKLTIVFDPQSRTEQGCDYLCFFKDKSRTDRWGDYRYCGRDGSENWPGTNDRPPLVIPSDSFTLLWTTDGSNVDWGWKFTITATYLPAFPIDSSLDQLDCAAYQLFETLYERADSQRTPPKSEFEGFARISDGEQALQPRDSIRQLLSACLTKGNSFEYRECDNQVKVHQCRVMDAEGAKIRRDKSCEADVMATLDVGEVFVVEEHQDKWLKVSARSITKLGEGDVGWIRQRSGDIFHVVSTTANATGGDLLTLGIDDINFDDESSVLEMDSSSDIQASMANFCSPFNFEMLNGQTTRSQSQAHDIHRAISTKGARDALSTYLSYDAGQTPAVLGKLGGIDDILLLVSHCFMELDSSTDFDKEGSPLSGLGKRLQHAVTSSDGDHTSALVLERCLEVLQSSSRLLPKGRGSMEVVETTHPYRNSMDQYWDVHIPGAKSIKVIFDRRCKTETGCDWMSFFKPNTNRTETFGPEQIGGRDENENWPGTGGRPPLCIEGDAFEVYFHSDSGNNDWGFKIYAIGILEDEDTPPLLESNIVGSDVRDPKLVVGLLTTVCWVLEVMTATAEASFCAGSAAFKTLCSAEMLHTLITLLEDSPQCMKRQLMRVLTNLCQWPSFHTLPAVLVENIHALITAKLRVKYEAEARAEVKSPLMQALVQCAVALDLAIDSHCFERHSAASVVGIPSRLLSKPVEGGGSSIRVSETSSSTSGCHQFELVFRRLVHPVTFGLCGLSSDSTTKPEMLVRWDDSGRLWVATGGHPDDKQNLVQVTNYAHQIQEGDTLNIQLDVRHRVLVLRKNSVVAAMIAGSGALIRWDMLHPLITEAKETRVAIEQASGENQIELSVLYCSPIAVLPRAKVPSWYRKVIDAVGMMLDLREDRGSNIVAKESRHPLLVSAMGISSKPKRNRISITGAVALEIRFDKRTKLSEEDELHFFYSENADGSTTDADVHDIVFTGIDGEVDEKQTPLLFATEASKQSNSVLSVGDAVVRSFDWQYSDEDGGPGSVGIVQEITEWGGQSGKGVRVRWQGRETEDVYRNGFEGYFDVQSLRQSRHLGRPFIIRGGACSYEFHPSSLSSQRRSPNEFKGSVKIDGKSQVAFEFTGESGSFGVSSDFTVEFWVCLSMDLLDRLLGCTQPDVCVEVLRLGPMSLGVDGSGGCKVAIQASDTSVVVLDCELPSAATGAAHQEPATLFSGEWMHLALVLSGSAVIVYQNGRLFHLARCKVQDRLVLGSHVSLEFGSRCKQDAALTSGDLTHLGWLPFKGHLYDVRVWDVALRAEQLRSHADGLDSVGIAPTSSNFVGDPRSMPGSPLSPLRASFLSPRSASTRSHTVPPPHMQKWITTNRTSKEVAIVRLGYSVEVPLQSSHKAGLDTTVYFEVHALSSGKLSVGWIFGDVLVSSRTAMLGEESSAFAIEPAKKLSHFSGTSEPLLVFTAAESSEYSNSRRLRAEGSFEDDIFCRRGDVIGCAFVRRLNVLKFFFNGELVAQQALPDRVGGEVRTSSTVGSSPQRGENEGACGEVLSDEDVSRGETSMCQISSAWSGGSRSERVLFPCASLGPLGAQGLAWNLGQRPFQYETAIADDELVSVLEVTGCSEDDAHFEIFDHAEEEWTPVAYRHRVQSITPHLVGWWKLNDGMGSVVGDSSGNEHEGVLLSGVCDEEGVDQEQGSCWDETCSPPAAARRRNLGNSDGLPSSSLPPSSDAATKDEEFWGYKFYVIPHFSEETVGRRRFMSPSLRFGDGPRNILPRHDQQLVQYVNKKAQSKGFAVTQLLHAAWSEIAPQTDELVRWPALVEIITGAPAPSGEEKLAPGGSDEANLDTEVATLPSYPSESNEASQSAPPAPSTLRRVRNDGMDRLAKRFKVLQEFNAAVFRVLPLTSFQDPTVGGDKNGGGQSLQFMLSSLVAEQRHRILSVIKQPLWENALGLTGEKRDTFELTLNRPKAMRHRATGKPDVEGRHTLFSQAFRELQPMDNAYYRRDENLYRVTFLGENAQDAGGPYRETLAQYCEELQSTQLELLLPTPNSQHNVGVGRERWLLSPSATSPTELRMLEFLGKLMGAAIRSKGFMSLNLAALVWKKLAGEYVGLDDLATVDAMLVNSMAKVRTIDRMGVTEEIFQDVIIETFTTLGADNRVLELKPKGAEIPVTFASRFEYADLVEHARLHEGDVQARALLRGITKVVPAKLLSCFSGHELESMICGSPEVDVDLLERCTEYSGCSSTDAHVVWFWDVLRAFSQEDRGAFLRFVWGRSRLPATAEDFSQRFKLQNFNPPRNTRGGLDAYLPVAHTCFFSLELPAYSSKDVINEKLLYAIYNCQAIDGDGDSVQANRLGWEE